MSSTDDGLATRPGRPRRFDETEECELLLDAAFEVMRRNEYQEVTVNDILTEAGLSTRSFYRHFASKDDLLRGLFRRDAERFAGAVARRVEEAGAPAEALIAWIDEILGFGLGRPRARRAAVLGSPAAMRVLAPVELRHALGLLVEPLAEVLRAGRADGSFPGVDPARDAVLVSALAWETSGRIGEAETKLERDQLRVALLSFIGRALESNDANVGP